MELQTIRPKHRYLRQILICVVHPDHVPRIADVEDGYGWVADVRPGQMDNV